MVKNLPCNAGDPGSIPGHGTEIPRAMEQLSLQPKLERLCAAAKGPDAATKTKYHVLEREVTVRKMR